MGLESIQTTRKLRMKEDRVAAMGRERNNQKEKRENKI
jgi:hypothetical protein